eukprot:14453485-Alexandrium_andersonii.AAC.1
MGLVYVDFAAAFYKVIHEHVAPTSFDEAAWRQYPQHAKWEPSRIDAFHGTIRGAVVGGGAPGL